MLKILINANLDLETKDERGRTALLVSIVCVQ